MSEPPAVVNQQLQHIEIEPLDAAVKAVELAYGAVEYWRVELYEAALAERDATPTQVEGYRMALTDLARESKLANHAGVVDRLAQITERMSEQLTLAAERGLAELARAGADADCRAAHGLRSRLL